MKKTPKRKKSRTAKRGQITDVIKQVLEVRGVRISLVFFFPLVVYLLRLLPNGYPLPVLHDEFSYLLAAQTFLEGRLSNPQHEIWPFFETFHVLVTPTYMSKFPPGIGLQLMVGYLVGAPIHGVWLTVALLSVSVYWALSACTSKNWSLVGAFIAISQYVLITYWGHTYWAGSLCALGGALTLGGLLHLKKELNVKNVSLFSLGIAIMSLVRPFEGLVFAVIPGLLYLGIVRAELVANGLNGRYFLGLVPAVVISLAIGFQLAYNSSITGSPVEFPHRVYQSQYFSDLDEFTLGASGEETRERHPDFTKYTQTTSGQTLGRPDSWNDRLKSNWHELRRWQNFYFPGALLGLLLLSLFIRDVRTEPAVKISLLIILMALVPVLVSRASLSHYTSAWVTPCVIVITMGLKGLAELASSRALKFDPAVAISLAVLAVYPMIARDTVFEGYYADRWMQARLNLLDQLTQAAAEGRGDHVVVVEYDDGHSVHKEWVYNGPNIDQQTVIWARSQDTVKDMEIVEYYPDRNIWLLKVEDRDNSYSFEKYGKD